MKAIKIQALLLPILLLPACNVYDGPAATSLADTNDRLLAEHDRYAAGIRAQQAQIAWENKGPQVIEFEEQGRVILRGWQLYGLPGEEYMQISFTYDNTSAKTFDRVRVWASVRDKEGEPVSRAWLDLLMPWFDFTPGNTYTTTLRVPTKGAHLQDGWHWTIGCSTHERVQFGPRVAVASPRPRIPLEEEFQYSVPVRIAGRKCEAQPLTPWPNR